MDREIRHIKVWLADDHLLVRQGIRSLLEQVKEVEVLGESSNGKEVLQQLRHGTIPNIVLLDVEMPEMGGLECLQCIKKEFFGIRIILLTMLNDRATIQQAYDLQADGLLFKNTGIEELRLAIHKVANGERYFAPDVAIQLLKKSNIENKSEQVHLTEREIEILRLITEGLSSNEIGKKLFISPRTVDTHRNNLIHKLEVNGVVGLVKYAIQHKIV